MLACYEAGDLRPSVPEVAARAGVSARSVHNHFVDVEALRAEVSQRQWERYAPLVGEVSTIDELVANRVMFFEAVTPGAASRAAVGARLADDRAQPGRASIACCAASSRPSSAALDSDDCSTRSSS